MDRIDKLWAKLDKEREDYKNSILSMCPENILVHAFWYTLREDILQALEETELDENPEIVDALLSLDTPVADIADCFTKLETNHMEFVRMAIQNKVNAVNDAKWVCSDPDCAQHIRPVDVEPGYRVYKKWECIQVFGDDRIGYGIAHETVDLDSIDHSEKDNILRAYYPEGIDALSAINPSENGSVCTTQIVAECVFETLYGMNGTQMFPTYKMAKFIVDQYVSHNTPLSEAEEVAKAIWSSTPEHFK